ncbi:MAG TPA: DUF4214 domain-containing protein [Iamia sp.]|nr:DUF4214 domain-containing protein [Iamia sp.]
MGITRRVGRGALAGLALVAATGIATATPAPSGAALPACTATWETPTDGSWDDGTRWSRDEVPTAEDHVCITVPGAYTVTYGIDGSGEVGSLRVGAAGGATTQTLRIASGGGETRLTTADGVEISPRGHVQLEGFAPGTPGSSPEIGLAVGEGSTIANTGTIAVPDDQAPSFTLGSLVNAGTLEILAPLAVTGDLTNDGTITATDDGWVRVEGTLWTRAGAALGRGTFWSDILRVGAMDAPFSDTGGSHFVVDDSHVSFEGDGLMQIGVLGRSTGSGTARPDQTIRVAAVGSEPATLRFSGPWTSEADIELRPTATGTATVTGTEAEDVFVNEGSVVRFPAAGAGAALDSHVVNRGVLSTFGGVLDVGGDLRNEGLLVTGLGELRVDGDVVLAPGSVVRPDLVGGAQPDAGLITTPGTVSLDGDLEAQTVVEGQLPVVGTTATVITGASVTGTFDDVRFIGYASYDPQYTATQVDLTRRASESPTRRFVRAAFQDFLGRQPTLTELSPRAAAIDGGTLTRASLVRQLSLSSEYVTALVQRFYVDTLGRPGDPTGVAFWVDQLRTGRKTVAEVAGSFYASPEYFDRAGGTNPAWITDLYDVFFERPPSSGDLMYWTTRIAQRGRTGVAVDLFQSLESRRQRVDRLYRDLLGRHGDPGGLAYWAGRITAEGDLALAVNLAASAEYVDHAGIRYP